MCMCCVCVCATMPETAASTTLLYIAPMPKHGSFDDCCREDGEEEEEKN